MQSKTCSDKLGARFLKEVTSKTTADSFLVLNMKYADEKESGARVRCEELVA